MRRHANTAFAWLVIGATLSAWIAAAAVAFGQGASTLTDVSQIAAQAQAALAAAQAAQSAIPAPCAIVPMPDTLNGSVGSGSCYQRPSDTRPTVVQAAIVTTDATGTWSVTWSKAFASATPYINPQAIDTGTQPYICNVSASTATTATGKCWQTVTMTLPALAASLLGLVLNPTSAATSIQVRVAARDLTQ